MIVDKEENKENKKENSLYGYLFHFNSYTGLWSAFKESDYRNHEGFRHPTEGSKAIFNKDIMELISMVKSGLLNHPEEKTIYEQYGLTDPEKNEN